MGLDLNTIATPKPARCEVQTDVGKVLITYDRAAFTYEMTGNLHRADVGIRLSRVLLDWDITNAGALWVPHDRDDDAHWDAVITAQRDEAQKDAPIRESDRRAAYAAAWLEIIVQLPRDFVFALDTGVREDFLGVKRRSEVSAVSLARAENTAISPGGTSTPAAS